MIHRIVRYSLLIALIWPLIWFIGCNEDRAAVSYIPDDAGLVAIINTSSIVKKLKDDYKTDRTFVEANWDGSAEPGTLSDQIDSIMLTAIQALGGGLAPTSIYFYLSDYASPNHQFAGIFIDVSDYSHLEYFIQNKLPFGEKPFITSESGYKVASFPNKAYKIAWNKHVLFVGFSLNPQSDKNLVFEIHKVFKLKEKQSVAHDSAFYYLEKHTDDIACMVKPGYLPFLNKKMVSADYLNDDITKVNLFVNFERGRIRARIDQTVRHEMVPFYKEMLRPKGEKSVRRKIDEDKLIGFVNCRYHKGVIPKIIKDYKLYLPLKAFILATGIPEHELYELAGGDLFFACSEQPHHETAFQHPDSAWAGKPAKTATDFTAELVTNPRMDFYLSSMVREGILQRDNEFYSMEEITGYGAWLAFEQNKLLITSDSLLLGYQETNHAFTGQASEVSRLINDYPISAFVHLHKLANRQPGQGLSLGMQFDWASVSTIADQVTFRTYPLENATIHSHLEVKLNSSEANSVSSFFKLIDIFSKAQEQTQALIP